jgi:glycine betaine/proline transport system ATP-binding protein
MDEPFSALDPLIRRQLQDQFLSLSKHVKKTTVFITHDLDEAIRMGDHIAIMNDGVIVQTGTPEDIVTNPKDDYVAEFVQGISKIHLVRAETAMSPLEGRAPTANTVDVDEELSTILDKLIADQEPITVMDKDHKPVGIITVLDALRALRS